MLSHEAQVLKQGLILLTDVLTSLEPLISRSDESPSSILLHEVASSGRPQQAMASMQLTPLLHGIVAAHAYISMFLHVCKVGQVRVWFVVAILITVHVQHRVWPGHVTYKSVNDPCFGSAERLRVFLHPLLGVLVHHWVTLHICVRCLAQEHNSVTLARAWTRTTRPGVWCISMEY